MAKFDCFRTLLQSFRDELEPLASEKVRKTDEIKRTFLPAIQSEKLATLDQTYSARGREIRGEFLHLLKTQVDTMQESEQGKITSRIDFELLNELNILASAGIPLTRDEISSYAEKAMLSGSSICCRKIQKMATDSGYSLRIPDEQAATSVLNETAERLNMFIRSFDGSASVDNWTTTDQRQIKMMASGAFLDKLEAEYETFTVSDLILTDLQQDGEQQEQRESPILNYEISEETTGESAAAQYAKQYSDSFRERKEV